MGGQGERNLQFFHFSLIEMTLLGRIVGMLSTVSQFAFVGALVRGVAVLDIETAETDC